MTTAASRTNQLTFLTRHREPVKFPRCCSFNRVAVQYRRGGGGDGVYHDDQDRDALPTVFYPGAERHEDSRTIRGRCSSIVVDSARIKDALSSRTCCRYCTYPGGRDENVFPTAGLHRSHELCTTRRLGNGVLVSLLLLSREHMILPAFSSSRSGGTGWVVAERFFFPRDQANLS